MEPKTLNIIVGAIKEEVPGDSLVLIPPAVPQRHILTVDEFYSPTRFRVDYSSLMSRFDFLLEELDGLATNQSFTGNAYWFHNLFANFLYIDKVVHALKGNYSRINVLPEEKNPRWEALVGLHPQESNFSRFCFGLRSKKLLLMEAAGNSDIKVLYTREGRHRFVFPSFPFSGSLWVVQDGYELPFVKKRLVNEGRSLFHPVPWLIRAVRSRGVRSSFDVTRDVRYKVEDFTYEYFHSVRLCTLFSNIFVDYYTEVASHYSFMLSVVLGKMQRDRTKALLFSVGANKIVESVLMEASSLLGIPSFYFQHGGGLDFGVDLFARYFEKNLKWSPIIIDRKEFGSPSCMKVKNVPYNQRPCNVLYCPSSPIYHSYKDLLNNESDFVSQVKHRNIMRACYVLDMPLDVKVHPTEEKNNYRYFKEMAGEYPGTKVLKGGGAESILNKYKVVIVDYLTSGLIPFLLSQDMHIIYYTHSRDFISNEFASEIDDRIKVINNEHELLQFLQAIEARGCQPTCQPTNVARFRNKYCCPLGAPAIEITNYILGKIK